MTDDRKQELERLERELLADQVVEEDDLLSDLPIELLDTRPLSWNEEEASADAADTEEEPIAAPIAAEDDALSVEAIINETLRETEHPSEPEAHDTLPAEAEKQETPNNDKDDQKKEDRWLIILMAIASFLALGIIGILIYWLEAFLK